MIFAELGIECGMAGNAVSQILRLQKPCETSVEIDPQIAHFDTSY
jgi:hypothetical protein